MMQLPTMLFLQTAPVQEECNGPMPSPKPQEPSTNHTGSGNMTFPQRIKTSPPVKCRILSPLTCVAISRPQTSASCRLSGGPFRDSSPPRRRQARLTLRYAAKINLACLSFWPLKLRAHHWSAVERGSDSSGRGITPTWQLEPTSLMRWGGQDMMHTWRSWHVLQCVMTLNHQGSSYHHVWLFHTDWLPIHLSLALSVPVFL